MKTKSGKELHPIGIGTWGVGSTINPDNLGSKYRGVEPVYGTETREINGLRYSIYECQNHIDCAELYGGFYTDEIVGRAIEGYDREALFIADKLWKTSVAKGQVRPTVKLMLKKLGTKYLDMLYIHAPFSDAPWTEAIPQIDELIDEGIVRYFGVSNFNVAQMQQAKKLSRHPIAANQINYNVLNKENADQDFINYCQKNKIQIVAYQPLKRNEVAQDDTVNKVAKSHKATAVQISLAWLIAKNTLPIPKATDEAHINENLGALKLKLTDAEMLMLDKL